jgi:hypothetical protein
VREYDSAPPNSCLDAIRQSPRDRIVDFSPLEIVRPDQHSEAVCHEIRRDLKADSLIIPVTRAIDLFCIVISLLML